MSINTNSTQSRKASLRHSPGLLTPPESKKGTPGEGVEVLQALTRLSRLLHTWCWADPPRCARQLGSGCCLQPQGKSSCKHILFSHCLCLHHHYLSFPGSFSFFSLGSCLQASQQQLGHLLGLLCAYLGFGLSQNCKISGHNTEELKPAE